MQHRGERFEDLLKNKGFTMNNNLTVQQSITMPGQMYFDHDQEDDNRVSRGLKITFVILVALVLIMAFFVGVLYKKWNYAEIVTSDMFRAEASPNIPVLKVNQLDETPKTTSPIYDHTIRYKGKTYKYNDNLVNILLIGVDDYGLSDEETDISPYQADTLMLGTVDVVKKTTSFISIPRDTVTDIMVLDLNNKMAAVQKGPIAIQHSFGSQGSETNEAVVKSVSNLLYGIPIYRYIAVDISALPSINDSLGGITVNIPEDLTRWSGSMKKGVKDYTLKGDEAVIFVARRDIKDDTSAIDRMYRQIQYMSKLFPAFKARTKENMLYPLTLYNEEADKVDTNLSTKEILYLTRLMMDTSLDESKVTSIPGEMKHISSDEIQGYAYEMGFVPDEKELKDLIIQRFYTEVQ